VLVLGGTGFRGHPTVERLLAEGHEVTVLSRGHNYWGVFERLKGRIQHLPCNRTLAIGFGGAPQSTSSGLVNCTQLQSRQKAFDAVVDFSSRTPQELKQAVTLLKGKVGVYILMSSHAVYDVSKKDRSHDEAHLLESDAVRPGCEVSPMERYQLKSQNDVGDKMLECEEELLKQYDAGGFPFVVFRLASSFGPKENTIRYWLLHLWVRAHLPLTLPMHLAKDLLDTPISMTYTPDIAQAVVRAISRSRNETCCPEHVHAQAFNLACEEAPTQRSLYNYVAEPIGVPYTETIEVEPNRSIVLYPEIKRGHLSIQKALQTLRWAPTDLQKSLRSVARFYDRVMLDVGKFKVEREAMYAKCKKMLGSDGERFVEWTRAYYAERRKTELYDELDDEDEEDILLVRPDPEPRKPRKRRRRKKQDL